ncbi:MAG: AMP-binding protein [Parvibaculum sp.]|uniref:AMP-binding protein n=1 Tax=Parvibaculum sp. TaxID=2024848 RepID=UPI0025E08C94|nr:AMP-binding protein [Parvibaculum sp.]MCE9648476.1 AMP-binding protein [Parvibaculum sp.]
MRVYDYFRRSEAFYPDRVAFVSAKHRFTYREMGERTRRIGAALAAIVSDGGRIAVYSPNDVEAFACVLGIFAADAVWVPLNARNAVEENAFILENTGCEGLFVHSSMAAHIETFRAKVPSLKWVVCIDAALDGYQSLDQFVAKAAPVLVEPAKYEPERVTTILSTGGTTGRPKGVMWTPRVWESMIASFWVHQDAPVEPPVHLVSAPMTHAAGVFAITLMAAGATTVIVDKFEPLVVMDAIQKYRVSHIFLPPTAIYMMLAHPRVREFDYSSLRCFLYAAAPMSVEKLREAMNIFGPVMVQSYGQAEAPMFCTMMGIEDHKAALVDEKAAARLWSCGKPTMLNRLAIMDDEGNLQPDGERGEIVVQGSIVMAGYFRNAAATEEVSAFGWHHTGDVGWRDKDGYIYIVDRKKDMIISGGFNIYSAEVEQAVLAHPAVQDCAVVGVPDDKWGEAVKAIVELKPGARAEAEEIVALCKKMLGSTKAPKSVEVWDVLPRSPVGKVLKRDIRAKFWEGQTRNV